MRIGHETHLPATRLSWWDGSWAFARTGAVATATAAHEATTENLTIRRVRELRRRWLLT